MKKITAIYLFLSLFPILTNAQNGNTDSMANNGKIYVVLAVVLAIFAGIIIFLIFLDNKLTKLERQIYDND